MFSQAYEVDLDGNPSSLGRIKNDKKKQNTVPTKLKLCFI